MNVGIQLMYLEMYLLILVLILVLSKSVGMMMEIECISCRYFRLHELHDDVGMCMNKGSQFLMRMVMAGWQYPVFTEIDREGEEFYWRIGCRANQCLLFIMGASPLMYRI